MPAAKKKKKKAKFKSIAPKHAIDKPRAAKEGNRYHEAWLTRRSLELIFPRDGLVAIAVEGLDDETGLSQQAVEIADATFYFGAVDFGMAKAIQVEQFKYSLSREADPFRAADALKTLKKFAKAETDFAAKHGAAATASKLRYGITTNRPIYKPFADAVIAASRGVSPREQEVKTQLAQIRAATSFSGETLKSFCNRLQLSGVGDSVASVDGMVQRTIADWSASTDMLAKARMGALRKLVSDKAALPGQANKTIFKEDVLASFNVGNENDLLPTPDSFPEVGDVVERSQLDDLLKELKTHTLALVDAPGGIGKTVFIQSAANRLQATDEVVLFDCFGGGAYRIPTDGRHKPERGLMHIVNELASRGLCDPLLPGSTDPIEVVRTAKKRFAQVVTVLRRTRPGPRLTIILDAMDNSGVQADDLKEASFPRLLFETFALEGMPDGLVLVGTCRPERTADAIGKASCFKFPLGGFTLEEATQFVTARRPEATPEQIASLQHRSGANPRVLANLVKASRTLSSNDTTVAKLDDLIREQIAEAVKDAETRGAKADGVSAFLCALARLPPPVPIDELAKAFGQPVEAIESFAADLNPLLDRTRHGLIFRDEPTETLVRTQYGGMTTLLADVVTRLRAAQGSSAYATRSLPGLLFAIGDVSSLTALAFEDRFPPELSSDAAKRTIRLNRLRVAVAAAAKASDADAMTALLAELSSVAVVNERGDDYFLASPDLVMALGDAEAIRRLYESKKGWFGARPSRLAIAAMLEGELGEAHEEAQRSVHWLQWLYSKREDDPRHVSPATNDFAAWGLYQLETEKLQSLARFLNYWLPEHGYKVARRMLELDRSARMLGKAKYKTDIDREFAVRADCPAAFLAAYLSMRKGEPAATRRKLISSLAKKLKSATPLERAHQFPHRGRDLRDAVLSLAIEASSLGLKVEAGTLRKAVSKRRYHWYSLRERISSDNLAGDFLMVALDCALRGTPPTLFDCLPEEMAELIKDKKCPASFDDQKNAVLDAISAAAKQGPDPKVKPKVSDSQRYEWTDRFSSRLRPVMALCNAAYELIVAGSAPKRKLTAKKYLAAWQNERDLSKAANYGSDRDVAPLDQYFLNAFVVLFKALGLRDKKSIDGFIDHLNSNKFKPPHLLIDLVADFSLHSETKALAGPLGVEVVAQIGQMDNTEERSSHYSELARAILPADQAEAKELFARGYGELTAIGSGDYELVNELLVFACRLSRAPLKPEAAHTLGKIIELNTPYDSEKFPWGLAASAFAACWGIDYLAQIVRWDDRNRIGLEYTIGPAVTALIKSKALSAKLGYVLLSLVNPVELHGWQVEELLGEALEASPNAADALVIANEHLDLLERMYTRSVPERELIAFDTAVAKRSPSTASAIKVRTDDIRARQKEEFKREGEYSSPIDPKVRKTYALQEKREREKAKKLAAKTSVTSEDFEALVQSLNDLHGRLDLKTSAFQTIRESAGTSKRAAFVNAVAEAKNLELFAKIAILKDCKAAWAKNSPSGLSYFKGIGQRLAELHVKEMLERDWGFISQLNDLVAISGDDKTTIAVRMTELAATQEIKADATIWLSLAQIIAQWAKAEVPRDALTRILSSDAARLAANVGDGAWSADLAAPADAMATAAGVIWSQLGSQNVYIRWAAAHAVRRAAKLGLWPLIDKLFDLFGQTDAGPFQDRSLPFLQMHAQLWLLIAMARIAIDFPDKVAKYRPTFEQILNEVTSPHPVMQDAAKRALAASYGASPIPAAVSKLIDSVNVSTLPFATKGTTIYPAKRPAGSPEPNFSMEYDFNKYEVTDVRHLFGVPEWKIDDEIAALVHEWDSTVTSMYDFKGKKEGVGNSYTSRVNSSFHSYGFYLAWHAVDIVAGRHLKTTPIHQAPYERDEWGDWLSGRQLTRKDGLWVSDGSDPFPRIAGVSLRMGVDKEAHPTEDIEKIKTMLGIAGGKIGDELVVDGDWSSPDSIRVSIDTALVPRANSLQAAAAVATAPMHQAWLPHLSHYDTGEEEDRCSDVKPLEPWIAHTESYYRFDRKDPYLCNDAMRRARPSSVIASRYGLTVDPIWQRTWSASDGKVVFRARAWGARSGFEQRDEFESGKSLTCESGFLARMLQDCDRDLLVLVNLEHTKDYERFREMKDVERHTRTLVAIVVGSDLKARVVVPSASQIAAIRKLGERDSVDFERRYAAILKGEAGPDIGGKSSTKARKPGPSRARKRLAH